MTTAFKKYLLYLDSVPLLVYESRGCLVDEG